MEGDKRQGNSSSSITADLFGTKQPAPSSSAGIFSTIFSHPSKMGTGRKSSSSEVTGSRPKQLPDGVQAGNTKPGSSVSEGANSNICNKNRSSAFHEERAEPCHLSSSLYYGGQEVYSPNPTTYTNRSFPVYKKDGDTEDSNGNNSQGASRGNWWEGIHEAYWGDTIINNNGCPKSFLMACLVFEESNFSRPDFRFYNFYWSNGREMILINC